jgi:hypothetical protein
VSLHPLLELANERQVKQASGFKAAASELTGELLEPKYKEESANAPKRHAAEKKYLGVKTGRVPSGRQNGKDDVHLSLAMAAHAKDGGKPLEMPDGGSIQILDAMVPLRTAAPDKALGDTDPNLGVEDIQLLGLLQDDRVAVLRTKFLSPAATRGGAGDTPLRALLQGLAQAAMVDGHPAAFREEIEAATGRVTSEEAPALIIAAAPKYWELCRKREAQKGAGWIREMERLGREIAEQIGNEVFFVALDFEGEVPWEYAEGGPVLTGDVSLETPWEKGAGKLKPRSKKPKTPAAEPVVADLSKPPQSYSINGSYEMGDRIDHRTLGNGVVQGVAGMGKIKVLFGEELKTLIHERPSA